MGESKVALHTVADLQKLFKDDRIVLSPEFQRNSVWPAAARAYLIDTILKKQPIPQLFLQRTSSAQSGRTVYEVVDGQQRLRAIFDFLDGNVRRMYSTTVIGSRLFRRAGFGFVCPKPNVSNC